MPAHNSPQVAAFMRSEVHSTSIDYLRVTATDPVACEEILRLWGVYSQQEIAQGARKKPGGMQGFTGQSAGAIFWGRKAGMFMLQLSGPLADELFMPLAGDLFHCSRIDCQMTFRLPFDDAGLAEHLGGLRADAHDNQKKRMKPMQDLHVGYGKGDTLSIGSRSSPRYGRIYDKWRQSRNDTYTHCWRFEAEFKKVAAPKIVEYLRQEGGLQRAIAEVVIGQFQAWGLPFPTPVAGKLIAGSIGRSQFDSDRSLFWLAGQVAPTVERLLATVSEDEILTALGLSARNSEVGEARPSLQLEGAEGADHNHWAPPLSVPARRR